MDRKRFARQLVVVLLIFGAAGGLLWHQYREQQREGAVEQCLLSLDRPGEFCYQDVSYTIRDEPGEPVGDAVGYIQQEVRLASDGRQSRTAAPEQLGTASTVRYGDVYLSRQEGELAVEVNGTCLRAVPTDALSAGGGVYPGALTAER